MPISRTQWTAAGIGFIVAVLAGWWYSSQKVPVVTPTTPTIASSTSVTSTTTPSIPSNVTAAQPFPINARDTIISWNFKGAYTGNETLIAQANADIVHLKNLMGKGEYDDYDLYNGIANDKNLMGDGTSAYQNYNRAIAIHPKKGLVYANLGHLMDELGAYYTAADAYEKATTVEPGVLEYYIERLNYLTRQFATDTARITVALTDVSKQFGDTAQILSIEARWLTEMKRYTDAIKAWETVKTLSPGKDMTAIDAEIARLKAKQ